VFPVLSFCGVVGGPQTGGSAFLLVVGFCVLCGYNSKPLLL